MEAKTGQSQWKNVLQDRKEEENLSFAEDTGRDKCNDPSTGITERAKLALLWDMKERVLIKVVAGKEKKSFPYTGNRNTRNMASELQQS